MLMIKNIKSRVKVQYYVKSAAGEVLKVVQSELVMLISDHNQVLKFYLSNNSVERFICQIDLV